MKAQIWSEVNPGPAWARANALRIWRWKAPRRNGTVHGITLTWTDALAAVARQMERT